MLFDDKYGRSGKELHGIIILAGRTSNWVIGFAELTALLQKRWKTAIGILLIGREVGEGGGSIQRVE